MKKRTGTREWSEHSRNIFKGCSNGCLYCYARYNAEDRFKSMEKGTFNKPDNRVTREYHKKPKKVDGRIMFPTTHDITEANAMSCIIYLQELLKVGNDLLIVTKPRASVIAALLDALRDYKEQVLFRFTITSLLNDYLKFWEPNAPLFAERLFCLKRAHKEGYRTSVSIEPMLDYYAEHIAFLCLPRVTDSVWIGCMNRIDERVDVTGFSETDKGKLKVVKDVSDHPHIYGLYDKLEGMKGIMWKDSIRKMLNLPAYEKVG